MIIVNGLLPIDATARCHKCGKTCEPITWVAEGSYNYNATCAKCLTKEEFIRAYFRNETDASVIFEYGQTSTVQRCECEEDGCKGWSMIAAQREEV